MVKKFIYIAAIENTNINFKTHEKNKIVSSYSECRKLIVFLYSHIYIYIYFCFEKYLIKDKLKIEGHM